METKPRTVRKATPKLSDADITNRFKCYMDMYADGYAPITLTELLALPACAIIAIWPNRAADFGIIDNTRNETP